MGMMAALLVGAMGRARATAQRAQCDARLKAIVLAWDAFRQENGRSPATLKELADKKYLTADMLRCPADPRPDGAENDEDYSIIRAPRDDGDLPVVVCPFHEELGRHGAQGFVGRYTTQFRTAPARLDNANDATVQHPADPIPVAATSGMELHGGDRIRTGTLGLAKITFTDGSSVTLNGGTDLTVLQCFMDGQNSAPWYTVVRQRAGKALYDIHHGSHFDVVTPTATAGAHGTSFIIDLTVNPPTLQVTSGAVTVSTTTGILYGPNNPVTPNTPTNLLGLLGTLLGTVHL